jgi:serine/threonine protein kinase
METRWGKLLGRYEIVAELGNGAMGVVYKARDPKIDRFVAIKTILLHQSGVQEQREFRERFFVEAQAAGRLLHPGIVTVFDVGEEPETSDPYIVMEYIEGQTLRELLAAGSGKLPLATALQIIQELAEALDYAHAQGVVHRDIKPANILVTKEGQAKIGDFGIAQLDLSHITLPGRVVGTPAYMSPEQLDGRQVDGRSDLFSLGAILYSLVTGFSPFQGNSATTVCFKVANRDPLQATALAPELPPDLDFVITRALAKDPADRYQRGIEFALDLQELRHRPPAARKGTLWFSPSDARRTWLDAATKLEDLSDDPASQNPSKSTGRLPSYKGKPRPWHSMFNSSVLAGPLVALVLAAMVVGFFAWRQVRTPGNARQNPVVPPVESVTHTDAVKDILAKADREAAAIAPATPEPDSAENEKLGTGAVRKISVAPKIKTKPALSKAGTVAIPANAVSKPAETGQVPPPAPAVADSNVEIRVDNHFADASLSVWVDDHRVYEHALRDGHKKRLVLLGGGVKEAITIPVPAGTHTLRLEVRSVAEQYDESKTVAGEFLKNGEKVVSVDFEKHTKEMRVTLGGG